MQKVTTSIKVNPEVWKKFKIYCIEKGVDISEMLEKMISRVVRK